MRRILVAGASGHLGRHVVRELRRQGYLVRAMSRSPERLGALRAEADETAVADLAAPATLRAACEGVDVVFSCAGASMSLKDFRDRTGFAEVDYRGNLNLLEQAMEAGVGKMVYVSLFGGEELARTAYAGAHERFVRALGESGLPHTVVRPTGFFSFLDEILEMARAGRGPVLGSGEARTNPIHEADLAEVCAAAVTSGEREIPVGGPEVYTRREIVEIAFEAVGRAPKLIHVPPWTMRAAGAMAGLANPRIGALLEFGTLVSQVDAVAPAHGTRDLRGYFRERAGTEMNTKRETERSFPLHTTPSSR